MMNKTKKTQDTPYYKKVHKRSTKNFKVLIGHGSKTPKYAKKGGPFNLDPPPRMPANKLSAPPGASNLEEVSATGRETELEKMLALLNNSNPGDYIIFQPIKEIDPDGTGYFCKGKTYRGDMLPGKKIKIQSSFITCANIVDKTMDLDEVNKKLKQAVKGPVRDYLDENNTEIKIGDKVDKLANWLKQPKPTPKATPKASASGPSSSKDMIQKQPVMKTPPLKGPLYNNEVIKDINKSVSSVNTTAAMGAAIASSNIEPEQKKAAAKEMAKAHAKTVFTNDMLKNPAARKFVEKYADLMGKTLKKISEQDDKSKLLIQNEKDVVGYSMAFAGTMAAYTMDLGYSVSSIMPSINIPDFLPKEWAGKFDKLINIIDGLKSDIAELKNVITTLKKTKKALGKEGSIIDNLLELSAASTLANLPKASKGRKTAIAFGDQWLSDNFYDTDAINAIERKGYNFLDVTKNDIGVVTGQGEYTTPSYWTRKGKSRLSHFFKKDQLKDVGLVLIGIGNPKGGEVSWSVGTNNLIKYIRTGLGLKKATIVWLTSDLSIVGDDDVDDARKKSTLAQAVAIRSKNVIFINRFKEVRIKKDRFSNINNYLSGDYKNLEDSLKEELIKLSIIAKKYHGDDTKVIVSSGRKQRGHNHPTGKAADILVKGLSPQQTYALLIVSISKGLIKDGGVGYYSNGPRAKFWNKDKSYTDGERPHYDVGISGKNRSETSKWFWFKCKSREECEEDIKSYNPNSIKYFKRRKGDQFQNSAGRLSASSIVTINPLALPKDVTDEIDNYNQKIEGTILANWKEKIIPIVSAIVRNVTEEGE